MDIRVLAMDAALAAEARSSGASPQYGHPAYVDAADEGRAPCRVCLEWIGPGVRRTLFTYDPFERDGERPLPGPVYVHADGCRPYAEDAGFPEPLSDAELTLVAYGRDRVVRDERLVSEGTVEPLLGELLDGAERVHVRSTTAGCFLFEVAPAGASDPAA